MSLTLARLGIVAGSFPIAVGGDFESIATVTVGSGGASSIEFTSIPGTYQHLQIRGIARTARTGATPKREAVYIQFNGDTGTNYAYHNLFGTGAAAQAGAAASTDKPFSYDASTTTAAATTHIAASPLTVHPRPAPMPPHRHGSACFRS